VYVLFYIRSWDLNFMFQDVGYIYPTCEKQTTRGLTWSAVRPLFLVWTELSSAGKIFSRIKWKNFMTCSTLCRLMRRVAGELKTPWKPETSHHAISGLVTDGCIVIYLSWFCNNSVICTFNFTAYGDWPLPLPRVPKYRWILWPYLDARERQLICASCH
jgi:hypothetical protein